MNEFWPILFKISLVIFMAGNLLDMGLRLNLTDAVRGLRDCRFVAYTLLWAFILCPALAYAITLFVPLEQPYAIGLILLGVAPCAPFVPLLVDKAKGDLGYTAAFMLLASVGTVVTMPFTVPLLAKGLTASAWAIAKPLLIVVLIPMAVGVIINAKSSAIASKMLPFVKKTAGLAGLVFCLSMLVIYGKGLLGLAGQLAVAAELIFFGIVVIGTYLLTPGLPPAQKTVLSIGVTTRNMGASLTPLLAVPDMDQRATLMLVISLPIMVLVAMLGAKFLGRAAAPSPTGHN